MTAIVFRVHHLGALGFDGDCDTCGKHSCHWSSQNCATSTIIRINEVTIKDGTCQFWIVSVTCSPFHIEVVAVAPTMHYHLAGV